MPRGFSDQKREDIRGSLIKLALDAILNNGFSNTSISSITKAAGISKGAFYLFFETKEDLFFTAIMQEEKKIKETYNEKLKLLLNSESDSKVILRQLLEFISHDVVNNPIFKVLSDKEELEWLFHNVSVDKLQSNIKEDNTFFEAMFNSLQENGIINSAPAISDLIVLPRLLFILNYEKDVLAANSHESFISFIIDALVQYLT